MNEKFRDALIELLKGAGPRFDFAKLIGLTIRGVEVTQTVQHWHSAEHLTDQDDQGPDNSIRLVADKPALVRVYVGRLSGSLAGVTGTVVVQRLKRGIWVDSETLNRQWPSTVTAEASTVYSTERGSLNSTLNFVLPAAVMRGPMRLRVRVEVPRTDHHDDTTLDIDASLLQTLRVRGIPVRYWGPDAAGNPVRLAAPTLADFQSTAARSLKLFPVSQTPDITLAGTFTWSEPLTGNITTKNGKAQCPTSWSNLLFWLAVAKVVDGNRADRLYYALLPNNIPVGNAGGCGSGGGVAAGFINGGQSMAHELGHVLGLSHAPCGLVSGDLGDRDYPAYEPYDSETAKMASIGEYGIDPTTSTVYSPNVTRDVMSYCAARWISPYHYKRLIQHPLLDPHWVPAPRDSLQPYFYEEYDGPIPHHIPDPPPPGVGRRIETLVRPDPVPLVILTGMLRDEELEVRSVLRLGGTPIGTGAAVRGARLELLDARGEVIDRAPLRSVAMQPSCGCGCGEGENGPASGLVQALVPDRDGIAAMRVIREDAEVWSRRASERPPRIDEVDATLDDDTLIVRWHVDAADDQPIERAVRSSADDGRTWQALAVLQEEDGVAVPAASLTSGDQLVQVVVSDGFHTTVSDPVRVRIPDRRPEVAILWPAEGCVVRSGLTVRLWGVGTASDGQTLPGDALHWELDGEPVGDGNEVWVELQDEGEHRVTVRVLAGDHAGEASATFTATATGHR